MSKSRVTCACLLLCLSTLHSEQSTYSKWAKLKFEVDVQNPFDRKRNWILRPEEDLNFIKNMNKQIGPACEETLYTADSEKLEEMVRYPFIFVHAEQRPVFSQKQKDNLREYMLRGGFLYIDDCLYQGGKQLQGGGWGILFFESMIKLIPEILPEATIRPIPPNHEIFNIYYTTPWYFSPYKGERVSELPNNQFMIMEKSQPISRREFEKTHYVFHAVEIKNRIAAIITGTDLHCDWSGRYGKEQAILANQMMINIFLYAMTH